MDIAPTKAPGADLDQNLRVPHRRHLYIQQIDAGFFFCLNNCFHSESLPKGFSILTSPERLISIDHDSAIRSSFRKGQSLYSPKSKPGKRAVTLVSFAAPRKGP
jgi:hypothetical protein